jgi:hypothetical protein
VEEVELMSSQMLQTYVSKGISVQGIEAEQVVSGFLLSLGSKEESLFRLF